MDPRTIPEEVMLLFIRGKNSGQDERRRNLTGPLQTWIRNQMFRDPITRLCRESIGQDPLIKYSVFIEESLYSKSTILNLRDWIYLYIYSLDLPLILTFRLIFHLRMTIVTIAVQKNYKKYMVYPLSGVYEPPHLCTTRLCISDIQ